MRSIKKQSNPKHQYLKKMVVALIFLVSTSTAYAISITSPQAPLNCLTPEGTVGEPLSIILTTDVPAAEWGYVAGHQLNEALTGISLNINTGELTGTPQAAGEFEFQVIAADEDGNISDPVTLKLCINRPNVDVMLVLDKSGSMNQPLACGSETKWFVLKKCVQAFLEEYREWGVSQDRLGVVYFDHSRHDFEVGGNAGLHVFNDPPSDPIPLTGAGSVQNDMNERSPGGLTSLGGGILSAESEFDNVVDTRNIIVFSDGIQNREPSFDMATSVIADHGNFTDGSGFPGGSLDLSNPPRQMKLHSVAIGDNALATLMDALTSAGPNPGSYFFLDNTCDLITTLDDMFDGIFVATLSDFSPAIVDKNRIEIPQTMSDGAYTSELSSAFQLSSASQTFTVNTTADKIMIKAVGNMADMKGLQMNVQKDGVDFQDNIHHRGTHIMFFADKEMVESRGVTIGGDWEVSFNGRAGIKFTTTCIINDEYVDYNASLSDNTEPGDPLNISLDVNVAGENFSNLTQSRAIVLKPGQDLNDLFSRAEDIDAPKDWQTEPGVNPGQTKYEKLIALDPDFVNALKPLENIITLNNSGDGSYAAQFNNTKESGIYKVIFQFRGNHPKTGDFQRYHTITKVVDFGQADESQTTFKIDTINGTNKFIITPVNKFGHLIGPNRLNQIELLVGDKKATLTDNLDGTYEAEIPKTGFFNTDPDVRLDIKASTYSASKLSEIPGGEQVVNSNKKWTYSLIILLIIIFIGIIVKLVKKKKKP